MKGKECVKGTECVQRDNLQKKKSILVCREGKSLRGWGCERCSMFSREESVLDADNVLPYSGRGGKTTCAPLFHQISVGGQQ